MRENLPDTHRRGSGRRGSRGFLPLLFLIFGASGAAVFLFQHLRGTPPPANLEPTVSSSVVSRTDSPPLATVGNAASNENPPLSRLDRPAAHDEGNTDTSLEDRSEDGESGVLPAVTEENPSSSPELSRQAVISFFALLDSRPYIQAYHLGTPTSVHFSRVIQKMLDSPPVVSGETQDLFTVLKNTAHFYRVLGQQNIQVIKTILTRERDQCEDIFADLYRLSLEPAIMKETLAIDLDNDALYDYAGFFLATMGGRLYLLRRDVNLRLLVNYYAILVIDRTITSGSNRHGIDLKVAIESMINELESGGNQLRYRDRYLDRLYTLLNSYQGGASD